MKSVVKKEFKLKSGEVIPVGSSVNVKVEESSPTIAIVSVENGPEFKMRSYKIGIYFKGFKKPSAKFMDPDCDECIVPSLTGAKVEPDGWDSKGFPSMLLAAGFF